MTEGLARQTEERGPGAEAVVSGDGETRGSPLMSMMSGTRAFQRKERSTWQEIPRETGTGHE